MLIPLYGSWRPWVIVTFPTIVVGVHMLGLSCTCVLLVALTPLYGSGRPCVIDCNPPLESLS